MDQVIAAQVKKGYLEYLPVALFGSVMGMTGLSVAWRLAHEQYGTPVWIAQVLAVISIAMFIALCIGYGIKLFTAFDAAKAEFLHPIAGSLFGTFFISLLLIPILIVPLNLLVARIIWVTGAVGMTWFAWQTISRWISVRQQPAHATPPWIVPVVGVIDLPLALPNLGFAFQHEVAAFSVAVGLFFAIPIFTLILWRLLFEAPLPDALQPTLLILVAPFSVGFSAYRVMTGSIDVFAEILYFLTLFLLAVLIGRLRKLPYCCPFRTSWWAVSFPLAASAITAIRFATAMPGNFFAIVAWGLLALTTLTILALLMRTLWGIIRGELKTLAGP